ncbi:MULTISPECIES: DUF1090 domain-containing protein [Bartonella]|uniref:DUF1090 domain-containing protein n=1 Tax=Bartonella TaxID=773 RepID=UPI0018DD6AA5|nr:MULTISPECIES: DUF1090 domain-containing protein [Bartonella]MBH9975388.1 DUF1090 domain-containing protein [Bartonella choladocola]MBI0014995.1 DUF1090 domain-containing protein [Bartonella sp. B10834G3]
MKTRLCLIIPVALFSFSYAYGEPALKGCAAKKHSIETQLQHARQYNNKHQIKGLEKALEDNIENCDDKKLAAERKQKITERMNKVSEREAELNEAKARGDAKKISRKAEKLEKAKQELKAAQEELDR